MTFGDAVRTAFSDTTDPNSVSSKRVIAFISLLCLIIGYFANMIWKVSIDYQLYNVFAYIVVGATGMTAVEKFSPAANDHDGD